MAESNVSKVEAIRHSLAHLLASAVLERDPSALLGVGPVIEHGFYYDIRLSKPMSESDMESIESRMRELASQNLPFDRQEVSADEARKLFASQPMKLELIDEFAKEEQKLTVYKTGEFLDLCRGGHVNNTSEIADGSWKLDKIAGAYWRGNEKNEMLTRIYGLAFETKNELDKHLEMLAEAEKRDHRKLGKELDLFTFSPLVGSGLPLFTPKGTIIFNLLNDYVWKLRRERGYMKVDVPHITKPDLYKTSGHWDKFSEELFHVSTREGNEYALKPMNCPHHIQIFARKPVSYREMPIRYAETTKVYRDEQSGELSGLSRVLSITQDDAHVFCRHSQMKDEFFKIWDIIEKFYGRIGFDLRVRLSFHDPKKMERYLGTPEIWKKAEDSLREIAKERGAVVEEALGEAALYGPKVDFMAKDAIGREHQVATIQLDLNMPTRFSLSCTNESGEKEGVVMLHAAIMGSIERFMNVLIEHFAGAFPVWLSPVQVAVLPIGEKHVEYARRVYDELFAKELRVELWNANDTLGSKIRRAKLEKIPYYLVIGDKEEADGNVTVESRDNGKISPKTLDEFVDMLNKI
ncbi:MAG: threonine--tRNA ligase [Candidatus Vogelbacteria bacterium CG10_big_fil_rev_8_21_14_0_10_45_14]|uniref:Threonine--tRNA ligase n=1 Tax=Candidatus Vogelbacteria bacterium CG10_big_fil_rev_8_21_14_0_10_45_14 TaxID=1975042 RepID=A0A2H0RJU5_9BACT|nr:MAG: threonine--tRNA ligase [Candidatus Vogelbacteria bacterium CG10_big_fil_rev_8_21_14_0_10_45_14]